jgi:hypothetical protein
MIYDDEPRRQRHRPIWTNADNASPMNEPDNHTALVDRFGGTWVRADDCPGRGGNWWPLTDGPAWEDWARNGIGTPRTWDQVAENYGPFNVADPERTARAVERVRREVAR